MSNSQSFDLDSLKKMPVDKLMSLVEKYIAEYSSKEDAERFSKAYQQKAIDETKRITKKTLDKMRLIKQVSDFQEAEKSILDRFSDAENVLVNSDINEGGHSDNMGTSSVLIAAIVIIVAILVISIIGTVVYLKVNNKTVGDILSLGLSKGNKVNNAPVYSDKDRDMMSLIHELSIIYDNTDKYLNS